MVGCMELYNDHSCAGISDAVGSVEQCDEPDAVVDVELGYVYRSIDLWGAGIDGRGLWEYGRGPERAWRDDAGAE
jgi:hypothetical protein